MSVPLFDDNELRVWESLDSHKVYYKNNAVYGVIGIKYDPVEELNVLFCKALNDQPFTRGMLRDIIGHYRNGSIALLTDREWAFKPIAKALTRYGFDCSIQDTTVGQQVMLSTHFNGGE